MNAPATSKRGRPAVPDRRVALHVIRKAERGHNGYCGPAAVAAITGLDTAESAALIRRATGRTRVRGLFSHELLRTLRLAGFAVEALPPPDGESNRWWDVYWPKAKQPTFGAWLRDSDLLRDRHRALVLSVGRHFIVVSGGHYIDNAAGSPQPVESWPKRRARVRAVLTVDLP